MLAKPDFTKPFILHCDASDFAIGSVLVQKDEEGKEHMIGYFSKKLTGAELNYPTFEKECLSWYLSYEVDHR